ncbi:zinc ABC transporter substrate-binding protein [Thiotrichales bacterium 19S9-12]|nr:zinc ABC transporter substrate-binding protein [Thiotrichales bacterium 19S9-11]MCF6811934.1 zinc ABC transporter substrate-binding protein [Thiotrichales bacterium 19S9-12]
MKKLAYILFAFIGSLSSLYANINVVAAENFYGQVAKSIGSDNITVSDILSNPESDPHLFSTSPKIMVQISKADVIIYNGADYDPWMKQIIQSINNKDLVVIDVAKLMSIKPNANPHIWYIPETFPTLARKLNQSFSRLTPNNKKAFEQNLNAFLKDYQQVFIMIKKLKPKTTNLPVTATEPVIGYLAAALDMNMKGIDVQWRIMNDSEPSPKMMANYHNLFIKKQVKILFYNEQVEEPAIQTVKKLAEKNDIAIIGVSETLPKNMDVTNWILNILTDIDHAVTYE